MCATVYIRVLDKTKSRINLIVAKTRVAPIKSITIPRLELCASLLLCQLTNHLISSLHLNDVPIHLWNDSKVALAWISPHLWQTFVSHRVAEISRLTPDACWHHISGSQNPADLGTQGKFFDEFRSSQPWWNGPTFLLDNADLCPVNAVSIDSTCCPEKRISCSIVKVESVQDFELLYRYSTLDRLLRITALCIRFVTNLKLRASGTPPYKPYSSI